MSLTQPDLLMMFGFGLLTFFLIVGALEGRDRSQDAERELQAMNALETTQLSEIHEEGYYELQVTPRADEPLVAPAAGTPVVWYRHREILEVRKEVGGSTRTERKTLKDQTRSIAFSLEDDSGSFPVVLEGEDFEGVQLPVPKNVLSIGGRQYDEVRAIPAGEVLYIRAWIRPSEDGLILCPAPDGDHRFLFSTELEAARKERLTEEARAASLDGNIQKVLAVLVGIFTLSIPLGTGPFLRSFF